MDVINPPMTATAIGLRKLGSALPKPRATGNMPAPIANVVMMTGRERLWQASISASVRLMGLLSTSPFGPMWPRRDSIA